MLQSVRLGSEVSETMVFGKERSVAGINNPFFGKKHTQETKEKLRKKSKGKHYSPNTEFKKGRIIKVTVNTRRRLSDTKLADKNPNWKGDKVGEKAVHRWIKVRKQKPKFCQCCRKSPPCDLANISGGYKRDVDDYRWLCRKCHMESDGRLDLLKKYDKWKNRSSKVTIKELNLFGMTHSPRCCICHKNYVRVCNHTWKPTCKHNPSLRISIG